MNNFNNQNSQWSESPSPDQQPFSLPFVNSLVLFWQSQTLNVMLSRQSSTPIMQQSYSSPYLVPVQQGMVQPQAPTLGPSRNLRSRRHREAEAAYQQNLRASSRMISRDHSTDILPGYAWMDDRNNASAGEAWEPPSRNQSTAESMRKKSRRRRRSGPSKTESRDIVDVSVYEIPTIDLESM